jgi:hypothetical protein
MEDEKCIFKEANWKTKRRWKYKIDLHAIGLAGVDGIQLHWDRAYW